jgi:hypothetical protein
MAPLVRSLHFTERGSAGNPSVFAIMCKDQRDVQREGIEASALPALTNLI